MVLNCLMEIIKFRNNESWSEDFNFGVEDSSIDLDFSDLSLYNDGGSSNITLTAGTYDIKLWIDLTTATFKFMFNYC